MDIQHHTKDYLVVPVVEQVMLDIQKCHLLFHKLLLVVDKVVMVILFHGVPKLLAMLVHLVAEAVVPMVEIILVRVDLLALLQELVAVAMVAAATVLVMDQKVFQQTVKLLTITKQLMAVLTQILVVEQVEIMEQSPLHRMELSWFAIVHLDK